ncbi:MAG: MFS transporter [Actinomycetota bacterium]|nr:MFS transporter [Actinomycetota bacterium]
MTQTQKRWTLTAVILGSAIVFLDSTVVNLALPRIGQELQSDRIGVLEGQSYIYNAYLLTLSALLILAGALNDYFGRRRMFGVGLIGFGITSLLCGVAPSLESLILFRILQGATGALLVPGSLSIITASFEGEEQGRAFGIWAGASAATTILGPPLGGFLVNSISWRAAFLINLPLVALAYYATVRHVAESRDEGATGRFDWVGAAVIALAVGGLSFGAIRGQQQQWQDAAAFMALALGAAAVVAFPILMARSSHPLVPLELFRSRNFSVTNVSTLLIYGALYVNLYFTGIFVIGTLGYNEQAAGIVAIPATLLLALFSTRFGKLAARYGPRLFMTVGPVIMALGLLWLVRVPPDSEPWRFGFDAGERILPPAAYLIDLFPAFVVFGVGLVIMVAPLTTALMTSVPRDKSGVGSAINNAISRVGPQLAGAVIFVAIAASFYGGLAKRAPNLDTSSQEVRDNISPLNRPLEPVSPPVLRAVRESSTDSFHLAMLISSALLLAGAAVNGMGIRNPERAGRAAESVPEAAASPPSPAPAPAGARPGHDQPP